MLGNRYVAVIVGLLFVLILAYNIHFFSSRNNPEKTAAASVGQETASRHMAPRVMDIPEQVMMPADAGRWRRDPFSLKKGIQTPEETETIVVTGILKQSGTSRALVNGSVYTVDDRIGTFLITDIKKHSIVVVKNGITREISIDDYIVWEDK